MSTGNLLTTSRPVLEFHQEGHAYLADGVKMPRSVTKVLKDTGLGGTYKFKNPIHGFRGTTCHEAGAMIISGLHEYPTVEPLLDKIPGVSADRYQEYVKVHSELPGYFEAIRRAKAAIKMVGTVYECGFIKVSDGLGGKLDFCAWAPSTNQIWDIKSGTWPVLTVVQICGYEYIAARGLPIDPDHPGLDWLLDVVKSGSPFERCGLQIEKTGKFTAHYQTRLGESFNSPKWMTVWKSALALHKLVPDHEYVIQDGSGGYERDSRLSDSKWLSEQIKERLTGPVYDACMRAGENIFLVRQQYGLL